MAAKKKVLFLLSVSAMMPVSGMCKTPLTNVGFNIDFNVDTYLSGSGPGTTDGVAVAEITGDKRTAPFTLAPALESASGGGQGASLERLADGCGDDVGPRVPECK